MQTCTDRLIDGPSSAIAGFDFVVSIVSSSGTKAIDRHAKLSNLQLELIIIEIFLTHYKREKIYINIVFL